MKYPWSYGRVRLSPVGLRETCARVSCLSTDEVMRLARTSQPSLLRTVAQWRSRHPQAWAELTSVLALPVVNRRLAA